MHGVFTTVGIVLGDVIFILVAIFGLAVLAETMGSLFVLIKYLGAAYLFGLGVALWRVKPRSDMADEVVASSLLSSVMTGLLITLADQKAILFYLGFFPAFVDLSSLSYVDAAIILGIASVAVGGGKLVYAYLADRTHVLASANMYQTMNRIAGAILMAVAVIVMLKA